MTLGPTIFHVQLLFVNRVFCRDVIGENIILGDTRGGGGWGIDADFVGVSNIESILIKLVL